MNGPTQPTDPRRIIIRGGCLYGDLPGYVRPAYPNRYLPGHRTIDSGFRTAQCGAQQPLKGLTPP